MSDEVLIRDRKMYDWSTIHHFDSTIYDEGCISENMLSNILNNLNYLLKMA